MTENEVPFRTAMRLFSALFVAAGGADRRDLMNNMNLSPEDLESVLCVLDDVLAEYTPLQVLRRGSHLILATRKEFAETARLFAKRSNGPLSQAAYEALAMIAYKQPITKTDIDWLRGHDSEKVLSTLKNLGLIVMRVDQTSPEHRALYFTTARFLELLGLRSLADLPPLSVPSPGDLRVIKDLASLQDTLQREPLPDQTTPSTPIEPDSR